VVRSLLGGTLPLAGPALYARLNPNYAGLLLGLLEVAIIPIPFVFYRYGHKIRMKSALIRSMREDEERAERKRKRVPERRPNKDVERAAEAELTDLEGIKKEFDVQV
jgi:hypothetical protein